MAEYEEYTTKLSSINKRLIEEYSVPKVDLFVIPYDTMFNYLRGLKDMSIDMRRRPKEVMEAHRVLAEAWGTQSAIDAILGKKEAGKAVFRGDTVRGGDQGIYVGSEESTIFGISQVYLGHSMLTTKQWSEIYWPYTKQMIDNCAAIGKPFHLFSEADIRRFSDFFSEAPKGVVMLQPETDDVFELRKKLSNCAICGGMTPEYLGKMSKEQCLDHAKKLVEELGCDGGFVMGQNKMMSYKSDAKAENILAVQEFCANYSNK